MLRQLSRISLRLKPDGRRGNSITQKRHISTRFVAGNTRNTSSRSFSNKSWFYLGFPIIAPMVLLDVCEDKTSVVHAGFFDGKSADSKVAGKTKQSSFSNLDTLYEKGQWTKLYDSSKALYEAENDKDPEIVWRFARAAYEMSKCPEIQKDTKLKNKYVYEAFEVAKQGLAIAPSHFKMHLWYGILLLSVGEIEGSKVKIKNLPTVKEHFVKAKELNPNDGTALNLLGRWCKGIVEIDWFSRQIANTIFGTIPTTSYEEALSYFLAAEKIQPGFYLSNQLSIAQCLIALNRVEEAKKWLASSLDIPVITEEDKEDRKTVEALLKKFNL